MKFVKVTWIDTGGKSGWHDEDEMEEWMGESEENYTCVSSGYLYAENDKAVVLTRGFNGLGYSMDPIRIPRQSILKMIELQEVTDD